MGIKKTAFIVAVLLTSMLACSAVDHPVHAIGVIGTIMVGSSPFGIAYDSAKGEIFVGNGLDTNTVSVISDGNNSVIATIPVGKWPAGVVYDPGRGEIFVANFYDNTVSVISDSNNTVVATVTVGDEPSEIAYDSGKREIFVTNWNSNTVSVISDSNNTVLATISVGGEPDGVAYDSRKDEIFVANAGWNNGVYGLVSVISDNTNTVVATIPVGRIPEGVAYDSDKGEIYVTNYYNSTVSVISDNTNTVVATIPVGDMPSGVAYDSGREEIFVSTVFSDSLSVISDTTNTVVATVPVGKASPSDVAYDSGKGEIWVANGDVVSVVSDSSTLAAPAVFAFPSMVGQGQSSNLTSSEVNSGYPPYTYQWFSEAPNTSSYLPINGATSPSYNFTTSNATAKGTWSFMLQVTGFTGGSVNSTVTSVIVNAPPLSSAAITAAVSDNSATADMSATTGVNVSVSGLSLQNGTEITAASAYYGDNQPVGTGTISINGAAFYDVSVASSNGALSIDINATISIANPTFSSASVMEYWNKTAWVSAATVFTAPDTVSATIPASALTGTPIVVGTPKQNSNSKPSSLEAIFGVTAGLAVAATAAALMLITRSRKGKTSSNKTAENH